MKIVLFTICILFSKLTIGQSISGKIIDEKQKPVHGATVLLLRRSDSSLVRSALSDHYGNFLLTEIQNGQYVVSVALVSHQSNLTKVEIGDKDLQMPDIVMAPAGSTLKEVKLTAAKPFLEQKADKLIVNVEGIATAAGSTALEVLQKVPGILVRDDKITMVGKGTPAIYVDGRISQYTDVSQVLRDMSAANIEKIEVIANPGAKYDAAGGAVINIIFKRNASLGTNGSVSLTTGIGVYDKTVVPSDRFQRCTQYYLSHQRINGTININFPNVEHLEKYQEKFLR